MRDSLEITLTSAGFRVLTPTTAMLALVMIISSLDDGDPIDLLIMRLKQHGSDSVKFATKLHDMTIKISTLLLIDSTEHELFDLSKKIGYREYMEVPFEPDDLVNKAKELTANGRKIPGPEKRPIDN